MPPGILTRLVRRVASRLGADRLHRLALVVGRCFPRRPDGRTRVCVYSTYLQADALAMAHAFQDEPGVDLLIVTDRVDAILAQPLQEHRPLRCRILSKRSARTSFHVQRFRADVYLADLDLPAPGTKVARLVYCWHGLGMWKVKPAGELGELRTALAGLVGDVGRPNPRFLAQSYGATSAAMWTRWFGFAAENCQLFGMPFADWLRGSGAPYSRAEARRHLGVEHPGPVVLLCLSWHYGTDFGNWGAWPELVTRLARRTASRGGTVLLCLHSRHSYPEDALMRTVAAARAAGNVLVRFREDVPENLTDLLAADVMVCNYSSMLGYFYVTGRPSIHLDPRAHPEDRPRIASFTSGGLALHDVRPEDARLMDFDDIGGLRVASWPELERSLERAFDDPTCCRERSTAFLRRHGVDPVGPDAARIARQILAWTRPGAIAPAS
jgi:hypothetical protein